MKTEISNLIIGAGPAGLAAAGRLRKLGQDFILLEQSNQVAYSWQNHYHRLCLHTIKKFSALPHLPFPKDYPQYVPREKLVEYYENYATKFDIKPHFGEEVISVKKEKDVWRTKTANGKDYESKNVIICTGFNRIPFRPKFKGEEAFEGEITHSRDYRTAKNYTGQKVLVIGMGNTGAEIALDLVEQKAFPTLSIRSKINIVPRDFLGNPIQQSAHILNKLPNAVGDFLGNFVQKIAVGDLSKYGIETPEIAPAKQLREQGKTPVLDLGTVKEIKNRNIKIAKDVDFISARNVHFKDGTNQEFDSIILATGYRAKVEDFLENTSGIFNEYDLPKQPIFLGDKKGLYFLGYDAYSNGLLYSIHRDSDVVVGDIFSGRNQLRFK